MNDSFTSATLTDSVGSLPSARLVGGDRPSPSRRTVSPLSKVYKQASGLFLTRRLAEAYQLIEPLVTPPPSSQNGEDGDAPNGEAEAGEGDEQEHRQNHGQDQWRRQQQQQRRGPSAPVADASRSVRVKVWSLYLTLLNAIVELGPEADKQQFGGTLWKSIVASIRDGTVWSDVVRNGYATEGDVDPEVVANLYVKSSFLLSLLLFPHHCGQHV